VTDDYVSGAKYILWSSDHAALRYALALIPEFILRPRVRFFLSRVFSSLWSCLSMIDKDSRFSKRQKNCSTVNL